MRNNLARTILLTILGLFLPCFAYGQNNRVSRTSADENYRLDITESRVTETDYEHSASVELSGDSNRSGVFVRVGAIASAQKIDILLRGVTGTVRFRASLDALRKRIEQINQSNPVSDSNNR